jgi:predicted DNA-binding transcriptional regulator YafY
MSFSKAVDLVRLAIRAASHSGVSLEEIQEDFRCSERTAQRMTEALTRAFPKTERHVGEDRKARWKLPSRSIAQLLTPSADELVALDFAIEELQTKDAMTEATALRALATKVRALINPAKGASLSVDEEALLEAMGHAARPGPRPAANPEVDAAISTALKACSRLSILYRSRADAAAELREVEPYGLLLGFRRYLVARNVAKGKTGVRHYRVEDILDAKVLPKFFERPPDFHLDQHARRAFGSYQRDDQYGEVVWRFSPKAAERVRRFVFHPDQSLEEEPDGSVTVRFHASGHLEMCWHLYSWGDAVEVLAPPELAQLVHSHRRSDFEALP